MNKIKREEFIKKMTLLMIGSALLPKFLSGQSILPDPPSNRYLPAPGAPPAVITSPTSIHEAAIIDLHCHPSLKMYLWDKHMWHRHCPGPGTNPIAKQDDLHQLSSGYVKGLVATHYLVEAAAEQQWNLLKKLFPLIKHLFHSLADKLEHEDYSNFTQINTMIDKMESQIHIVNQRQKKIKFVVARDFSEFEQAIKKGNIPIAHAIEGAHALGRNFPISQRKRSKQPAADEGKMEDPAQKAKWYLRNLEALKMRGVCMITIGHIFKNDIAFPTEGISPDEKKSIGMGWNYTPEKDNYPLTDIGRSVVERMLEIGVIVDLTHCTPAGRQDVFKINRDIGQGKPLRPLAFTHVGAQVIFDKYDDQYNGGAFSNYKYYNISDEEIDSIGKCEGVIGVIPENFWLTGCDTHLNRSESDRFRNGIPYIIETMIYINSKTPGKDFDNLGIGTDFDGFADAPHDLYVASQLGDLINAMSAAGITAQQIKKITSGNAERLLRLGWGPTPQGPLPATLS